MAHTKDPIGLALEWLPFLLSGVVMTLGLAAISLVIGIVIGGFGAAMKLSGNSVLRVVMEIYTTIVRGVPELIIVYYFYFGINEAIRTVNGALGVKATFEFPVFIIAVLALGFVAGALATELFRTAYSAVPQSEIVAGRAYAMRPFLLFRRVLFPHVVRYSVPGLGNVWILLLKDSSLISIMGVTELLRATTLAANSTGAPFVFYLVCSAIYLVIALVSSGAFAWLERRYTV